LPFYNFPQTIWLLSVGFGRSWHQRLLRPKHCTKTTSGNFLRGNFLNFLITFSRKT
jgi:hypothetical protein